MSIPIINVTAHVPSSVEWTKAYPTLSTETHRWIGRCKKCGQTRKLEGRLLSASKGTVIETDHGLYMVGDLGSNPYKVWVPCNGHWCLLHRVTEGTKKSKHECGARCTNATGPNCDCRCKGRNHGSNC